MRHLKHYDDVAWLGFNSIAKDASSTLRGYAAWLSGCRETHHEPIFANVISEAAVVSLISLTDAKFLCR